MTTSAIARADGRAKGLAIRKIGHSGFLAVEGPPAFADVVARDIGALADRGSLYGVRPVAPVELDAERAIGVRRPPVPPDHALFTLVRRGDRYVVERQIVQLPAWGLWPTVWRRADEARARAYWDETHSLAYFNTADEDIVMTIGRDADAFSIAFDVEAPFAVEWKGTAHVYYRTVENVPAEHWMPRAEARYRLYDALPMLSERYTKRLLADDAAIALTLERSK